MRKRTAKLDVRKGPVGLGRLLLWLNTLVVPAVITCTVAGMHAALIVGVVGLLNAWYLDRRVRPKIERLNKMLERILRSWE